LKTLVVKVDHLGEVLSGTVVKIRSASGEAPKDRTFDAVEVTTLPCEKCFARIRGVDDVRLGGRSCGKRVGATRNGVDGKIGKIELRNAVGDYGIGFVRRIVTRPDVERQRERVIADVGCVVATRAEALERRNGNSANRGIVVKTPNAGDRDSICTGVKGRTLE
jgi:hypothetical protein